MPPEENVPTEEVLDDDGNVIVDEPTSEDEPPAEDPTELSEGEIKEAQNLYRLLKDPGTQKSVLRVLAEKAGVFETPPTTKTEEKEAKKDFKKILEEKLGPDLKWLVPKLGDALTEMFDQEREEHESQLSSFTEKDTIREVTEVSAKLNRETKGEYKKLESRMNQLAEEILPAPGMSVEKYCRHLYAIASSEKGRNIEKNKLADKITRNANNASERLRSTSGGAGQPGSDKTAIGKISIRDAVAQAAKALEKK